MLSLHYPEGQAGPLLPLSSPQPGDDPRVRPTSRLRHCSAVGNHQTGEQCLQYLCNVVYKQIKRYKILHQILHTLSLYNNEVNCRSGLEGIRVMFKNFNSSFQETSSNSTLTGNYTQSWKTVMTEWKTTKVHVYIYNVLACLSKPKGTYWSLTPQLHTVVFTVSAKIES